MIGSENSILVACGENSVLNILEVQLEGSKRMSSADFLRGHSFTANYSFIREG